MMDVCEIMDAIGELDDGHFIQIMNWMAQEVECRLMRNAGAFIEMSEEDMEKLPF